MKNFIVEDGFYQNPLAAREFALKAPYLASEKTEEGFAGSETVRSYFSESLILRLKKLIGDKIVVDPKRYSFGVFAKTYAWDNGRREIHVDSTTWTGLLYLSKPEDCVGGTNLYRHKETGLDQVPSEERLHDLGFKNREDFLENFLKPRGQDLSQWELNLAVGMKFNRLVLFRAGECFHGAGTSFGTNDESCRLIQLFFFNTEKSASWT